MTDTSELTKISTKELLHVLGLLINAQPIGIKATKDTIREVLAYRLLTTPDAATG